MRALVFGMAICVVGWAQVPTDVPGLEVGKPATAAPASKDKPAVPAPAAGRGGRGAPAAAEKPVAARAPSPRDLKYPPLHSVQPPQLKASSLPNGLKLYLSEQHELPVIGGLIAVRMGDAFDPADRIGMAAMLGQLLRSGGTELKSGEQVDQVLEQLGMTVETNVSDTFATVTFRMLPGNLEQSLGMLREMLVQPEFRQDRLEAVKARMRTAISHRNDDVVPMMRRELNGLIFGKESPYGWRINYPGLDRITRVDLKQFHKRFFTPGNTVFGLWGDFDAARTQAAVEKAFGGWAKTEQPPAEPPKATATPAPGVYLGERKDLAISHIMIGQPGGLSTSADYPSLEVMGILFRRVQQRIQEQARKQSGSGASYLGLELENVQSSWGAGFQHAGVFVLYASCRGAQTGEAIRAIQEDIGRMRTQEVSEDELRIAKNKALDELARAWDTAAEGFGRAMTYEFQGVPRDSAQKYQAGVAAVTRADILRVAKQYLKPDAMTVMVVGNPQIFITPLEKINPQVNRIDLSIPELKTAVTQTTDASIAAGKKLLQRAQAAVGGAAKLLAVKDYQISSEYQLDPSVPEIGGFKVPQTDRWMYPKIFRQDLSLPQGQISAYSDGKAGWISTRQGWGALIGIQLKQLQGDLFRSYFRFIMSDQIEGRTVNQVDEDLVEVSEATGQIARMEFDPDTGLPRRATYDVPQQGGAPLFTEDVYSDFRDVDGIKVPFKTVITQGGRKFADVIFKDVKINSGLRQVDLALRPQ